MVLKVVDIASFSQIFHIQSDEECKAVFVILILTCERRSEEDLQTGFHRHHNDFADGGEGQDGIVPERVVTTCVEKIIFFAAFLNISIFDIKKYRKTM